MNRKGMLAYLKRGAGGLDMRSPSGRGWLLPDGPVEMVGDTHIEQAWGALRGRKKPKCMEEDAEMDCAQELISLTGAIRVNFGEDVDVGQEEADFVLTKNFPLTNTQISEMRRACNIRYRTSGCYFYIHDCEKAPQVIRTLDEAVQWHQRCRR